MWPLNIVMVREQSISKYSPHLTLIQTEACVTPSLRCLSKCIKFKCIQILLCHYLTQNLPAASAATTTTAIFILSSVLAIVSVQSKLYKNNTCLNYSNAFNYLLLKQEIYLKKKESNNFNHLSLKANI